MKIKTALLASAVGLMGSLAAAECDFDNPVELSSMSAGFDAWKAVTDAMAECGNFTAKLDPDVRDNLPGALAANPALHQIGGVANATLVPLINAGTVRPLDDLVEKYGQNLSASQLIRADGKIMAIAMMVNLQHLMYREDILNDLGLDVPTTWDEVLAAAEVIQEAGVVEYPLGGTFQSGWNLAQEFVNIYLGEGDYFLTAGNLPNINNEAGIRALEIMKAMTDYMDPNYLASDSAYVQQQFQQGKIAMANLWASRAAAMDDEAESQVVGKVMTAAAPMGTAFPASSMWWDGFVLAANQTDEQAEAPFQLIMEGLDSEMVQANNDAAVWLVDGYEPNRLSEGAIATADQRTRSYPASEAMGILQTELGNGIADYLTGAKDAATTLADIETAYLMAALEAGLVQ